MKREKHEVEREIGEFTEIAVAGNCLELSEISDLPDLSCESDRNKGIMCMVAAGFRLRDIASAFKLHFTTVSEIVNRIDPHKRMRLSPDAKRAFLTSQLDSLALLGISSITYDELLELDAEKRVNVVAKAKKISMDLNQSKHREVAASKLDMMLDQALGAIEEADIKEIKN